MNEELKFLRKFKIFFFFFFFCGWGVRADVNEELKFLRKYKKKIFGGVSGSGCRGSGWM